MTATYRLIVYGCQMNDYDGDILAGAMEAAGYAAAEGEEHADVTLVYTCAVRRSATDRAWGRITSLAEIKRARKDAILAVGGCWAAVEGERIREGAPHVDFTFGTDNLLEVPARVAAARGDEPACRGDVVPRRRGFPRANVSIMKGCDNYCSYCIVPFARGREESRPAAEVLGEIEGLVSAGFRDITLIGQNVNSYRAGKVGFAELLGMADPLCDGVYLRFTTNHPRDFGPDVIAAVARGRNVARHLHLPLQSGADRVLNAMNRGYDRAHYDSVVAQIRRAVPGICLTTDLLVGFPGETEADFIQTLAAVEGIRFDSAYTFIYSPRPGTAAARLDDDIPRPEKVRRLQTLVAAQQRISREINDRLVGTTHAVVVEGRSAKKAGDVAGRLSENKIVNFEGDYAPGESVTVVITAASSWTLRGETRSGKVGAEGTVRPRV